MSKSIYTNSIVSGLFLVAILAFGLFLLPTGAHAQTSDEGFDDGYDHYMYTSPNPIPVLYSISPKSANPGNNVTNITITGHGFKANSVARWNGSDRPTTFIDADHLIMHVTVNDFTESATNFVNVYNPSRQAYSAAETFKVSGFITGNTGNSNGYNPYVDPVNSTQNNANNNQTQGANSNGAVSTLASNAIFGANSLVPTGIIQWILFAIIILLIIIIARKVFGLTDKYHHSPLKHA